MNATWIHFPGGWYCDATRTDHAVLYPDKRIGTSRGDLALPGGGNLLYLRCQEIKSRFCVAGQGHHDGYAWLWNGFLWASVGETYGTSPCCFGPLGLYVSTPKASDNILVLDVETGELVLTLTKPVGARGIAAVTGLGINPSDIHSIDEWYGQGGLAEYTDLGTGLLVGQGASGGLCARDGEAFVELEPGSVKFTHAILTGTLITAAAWKDAEQQAVVVRVERSELHPEEPPMRPDRYWLAPNIASRDLIQLLDHPESLTNVGMLQLYVQQVLFDGANQGANTSQALIQSDFYRRLMAFGIPLAIEMGSVKDKDCQCTNALHDLEWAVKVVREHGGEVIAVSQDEPLTAWIDHCSNRTIGQIADSVAIWMKQASALSIPLVGWIEAWPHVGFAVQQQFLNLLAARGVVPSHWHLDIDWDTAESQGKNPAAFLKAAQALADARGVRLGVMVNSTKDPIATDAEHAANLGTLAEKLQGILPDAKRVIVQSWAFRTAGGLQDVPNNLGASGLVASLSDVVSRFGAVDMPPIPEPEPPPIEENGMKIAYAPPVPGFVAGELAPHPDNDGSVQVKKPNGKILCVTPEGAVEERTAAGPWEKFTKGKTSLIAEREGGRVYVLPLAE